MDEIDELKHLRLKERLAQVIVNYEDQLNEAGVRIEVMAQQYEHDMRDMQSQIDMLLEKIAKLEDPTVDGESQISNLHNMIDDQQEER